MLSISLCEEKKRIAFACKSFGRIYGDAFYLYAAESDDGLLAEALFEVKSSEVEVAGYSGPDDDFWLLDGLLRAGLNYAQTQGIPQGRIPEAFRYEHRGLFAKLNYPGEEYFDITNFFGKYKNCGRG